MKAVERVAEQSYDLILMDCHMPALDGFEATKAIREMGGVDDYLSKPFTQDALFAKVRRWLPALERGDQSSAVLG